MKKILLAVIGTLSIATAVMAHPVVTHIAPSAAATAGYSLARAAAWSKSEKQPRAQGESS